MIAATPEEAAIFLATKDPIWEQVAREAGCELVKLGGRVRLVEIETGWRPHDKRAW